MIVLPAFTADHLRVILTFPLSPLAGCLVRPPSSQGPFIPLGSLILICHHNHGGEFLEGWGVPLSGALVMLVHYTSP